MLLVLERKEGSGSILTCVVEVGGVFDIAVRLLESVLTTPLLLLPTNAVADETTRAAKKKRTRNQDLDMTAALFDAARE